MKSTKPADTDRSPGLPNWAAVEERLQRERRERLPATNTDEAVRQFRLAWKAALAVGERRGTTGLVEQQACFSWLRSRHA
ncbi:MAG: hypothetical protein ACP5I4_16795 [Oceanipulchritudo sp.]|jgi:hypothetical protein